MANIITQPEDFTTTWVPSSTSPVANTILAPDGTLTADTIVDNNAGGAASCEVRWSGASLPNSTPMVFFGFFKEKDLSWVRLTVAAYGTTALNAYFDLANGVIGPTVGAGNTAEHMDDMGDGWWRCGISFTSDAVSTTGSWRFRLANGDNDFTVDRDGTSSIYGWGAVLDEGTEPFVYTSVAGKKVPVSAALADPRYPRDAMPLDNTDFHTFITDAGGPTGMGLNQDYKHALGTLLGYTGDQINNKDLPSLYKEYYDSL